MRAELSIIIGLVLFIFIVDGLLYHKLRKFYKHRHFPKVLNLLFWIIPFVFSIVLFFFYIENSRDISESKYYTFTLFNGVFVILYAPKVIYLIYALFYEFVIKIVSIFSWRKPHSTVKSNLKGNKITRA